MYDMYAILILVSRLREPSSCQKCQEKMCIESQAKDGPAIGLVTSDPDVYAPVISGVLRPFAPADEGDGTIWKATPRNCIIRLKARSRGSEAS